MRWEDGQESENVEDRRGMPVGGMVMGGGLGMLVIFLLAAFLGMNPQKLMEQPGFQQGAPPEKQLDPAREQAEAPIRKFVAVVFRQNEDVWSKLFREKLGRNYEKPKLVVFTDQVRSRCGDATAAVGPFYCPADKNVYLDFSFFAELQQKFQAKGDFAMAYVIAHEVGHHVQNLLGISDQVTQLQARAGKAQGNELSVRLELQADFLAGVWAHHLHKMNPNILEKGDLEEGLIAARQIGDDKLSNGRLRAQEFTHGSSKNRMKWLKEGMLSGDLDRMMELFEIPSSEVLD